MLTRLLTTTHRSSPWRAGLQFWVSRRRDSGVPGRFSGVRLFRQHCASPPQPWRRPTTQPGAQHHGADRHANRLRHPSLSPTAPGRGRDQQGKPTLPQALRRTADLPHPRRDPPSTRSARVNCLTRYGSIPAAPETLAGPRWFIRNRRSSRAAPAMKEQCVLGCDGMKRLREKGGPGGQSG